MFFGVGALITALLTQFGIISSFNIQIIVFIASSVISLLTFRKRWSTYFSGNVSHRLGKNESIDDIKGKRARVINTITPGGIDGKVEFNGTNWDADAEEIIQSGEIVVIEAEITYG